VVDDRSFPPGYSGPVFVWDIDKTYLATRFSQPRYMARIPIEFAVDKRAIPGMPEVIRGLRRGTTPVFACAPLYFVSASPPQLRPVIARKMLIDGVDYDGITFKDWVRTIRQGRPGRLKEQVGFKICALLEGRKRRPLATEYLFGDDYEKDAIAYSLYARIVHQELSEAQADDELAAQGVKPDDRACIRSLRASLPDDLGTVERIFIHLERKTPPREFDRFRPRLCATRNAFQLALALAQLDLVDVRAVRQAARCIQESATFGRVDFDDLLADAVSRGLVSADRARDLSP
jgi:hypothetical protein